MGLDIVVLVKQVPDTQNITGEAMKEDGTVNRAALPAIFNPEDLNALEAALQVKHRIPGTTITAVSMGPPAASNVLKQSLYRGADRAVLISDKKFAAADTLATSYTLACAIRKAGRFDLVCCGRQAIDGDTAQVGPQTAEKLGVNQITSVAHIESIDDTHIRVRRSIEGGYERIEAPLPLLLTFTDEWYMPRPPSAKGIMQYKSVVFGDEDAYDESYIETSAAPPDTGIALMWDMNAIDADPEKCGLAGSPTKVKKIESAVFGASETTMVEATREAIAGMIQNLKHDHTLE